MSGPKISHYSATMELSPAPINAAWILEGAPLARNRLIAPSSDRFGWTMLWDCTAGKFNWHYSLDETVHIIEGSVTVTDSDGTSMTLVPGDIAFFPKGCVAHWHVETYVRKVAYCQKPAPAIVALPLRLWRRIFAQLGKAISLIPQSLAHPIPETDVEPQGLPRPTFEKSGVHLVRSPDKF